MSGLCVRYAYRIKEIFALVAVPIGIAARRIQNLLDLVAPRTPVPAVGRMMDP